MNTPTASLQLIVQQPLFGLFLSLCAYRLALYIYEWSHRSAIFHPVASASLMVAGTLKGLNIPYADYLHANGIFTLLLGPATVALAIPLYREFGRIRESAAVILVSVAIGAMAAIVCAVGLAALAGAPPEILLALSPKSVTNPIALGIANSIGANAALTTGVVVFTGVFGGLMSPLVFKLLRLKDPRWQGLVLGLNAHGVGTARSFELSPVSGAFASLAMGLTGVFTALTLPWLIHWITS